MKLVSNKALVWATVLVLGATGQALAEEGGGGGQAGSMPQSSSSQKGSSGSASSPGASEEQGQEGQQHEVEEAEHAQAKAPVAEQPQLSKLEQEERIELQQRLGDLGFYRAKVDGIVGPKTRQALSEFQKSKGMPGTGNLDAATAKALGLSFEIQPVAGKGEGEIEAQRGEEAKESAAHEREEVKAGRAEGDEGEAESSSGGASSGEGSSGSSPSPDGGRR
jgi:peptidoglycan hydrolase-like protein with peptidoglycan-binding domain